MFPLKDDTGLSNDTPLPLLVAKRWNFPLAHHDTDAGVYYAVQDWMRGLTGDADTRKMWTKFKTTPLWSQMSTSSRHLDYQAQDGKVYQREFVTDRGLYLIAQTLRVTKARPMLDEIKRYLASAGVFADAIRRDPNTIVMSGAVTPDQAIDAAIQAYRAQGKDDRWIRARLEGKIKRNQFTAALTAAVSDMLTPQHYATATDDIYRGLWGRTAAYLKKELALPPKASLRDHQPVLALHYQGIAEEVSAQKLGQKETLSWIQARQIVQTVAEFVGRQAKETSQLLGTDLATGKALLHP